MSDLFHKWNKTLYQESQETSNFAEVISHFSFLTFHQDDKLDIAIIFANIVNNPSETTLSG